MSCDIDEDLATGDHIRHGVQGYRKKIAIDREERERKFAAGSGRGICDYKTLQL